VGPPVSSEYQQIDEHVKNTPFQCPSQITPTMVFQ
jgi:hypothetical protein